jgi:hypothetical protein
VASPAGWPNDVRKTRSDQRPHAIDTFIHIRSAKFPILPDESEEMLNEGMYGKAVAQYLQVKLRERGYCVPFFGCEDWGWWVELRDAPFAFGVCIYCGPEGEGPLDFFIRDSIHSRTMWSWRRFWFVDTEPWRQKLYAALANIFREDPEVELLSTDLQDPIALFE